MVLFRSHVTTFVTLSSGTNFGTLCFVMHLVTLFRYALGHVWVTPFQDVLFITVFDACFAASFVTRFVELFVTFSTGTRRGFSHSWSEWSNLEARNVIESPHRLVVRTSRCGRDNPGSTPGVDIFEHVGISNTMNLCPSRGIVFARRTA